jgi:hypothetical protein
MVVELIKTAWARDQVAMNGLFLQQGSVAIQMGRAVGARDDLLVDVLFLSVAPSQGSRRIPRKCSNLTLMRR